MLIVDDSRSVRRAARSLLVRRGYEVAGEAAGVDTGMAAAVELAPAAALIDLRLPDGSGLFLAARLKARFPRIAILIASSDDDGDTRRRAEAYGAAGFVLKSDLAACDLSRFLGPCPVGPAAACRHRA